MNFCTVASLLNYSHSGVLGVHAVLLSVMGAASEVIVVMLQIVMEVPGTVCNVDCSISLKQLIVSILQQLIEVDLACQVIYMLRLRNASTRWRSVAVMNPLHAGDARTSAAIRRPLGRRRDVDRSQSYHGVAAREARTAIALSLINNSMDMF